MVALLTMTMYIYLYYCTMKLMEIFYFDKSGRKYKGKERTCPTCGEKEIVRDSNNSKKCQQCQRPPAISEVTYIDNTGETYAGRHKKCKGCGKESIVRMVNKTEYCRSCICKFRKNSIKDSEFFTYRKNKKVRAEKIVCPVCKKIRLKRKDCQYLSDLCRKCRGKIHMHKLGKKYGSMSYKTGIGSYRNKKLNLFKEECECCGTSDNTNNKIIVHHKDCNRNNNILENLLILCQSCHQAIHIRIKRGKTCDEAFDQVKLEKSQYPGKWGSKHINLKYSI